MQQKISDLLGTFGFLVIFLVLYQTYAVWRHHGRSPLVVFSQGSMFQRISAASGFLYPPLILTYAMWPHWFASVPFARPLDILAVKLAGAAFMAGGLGTMMISYVTLGMAWRIGTDEGGTDHLVERGIYGRVRHPVYSAIFAMYFGVFLLVPNLIFLTGWVLHVVGFVAVAKLEEAFLAKRFGDKYRNYCARTGRFLP